MIADVIVGGVLIPGLLVLALAAAIFTAILMRALSLARLDSAFARKPLVEISLFVILFVLLVQVVPATGLLP